MTALLDAKIKFQTQTPPTLNRMREGILRLGLTLDPKRSVLVAGTNGKGSVCATLEALLVSAGVKTALFTSPHLEKITERMRIVGRDVSDSDFCAGFNAVQVRCGDLDLTHFEFLTLMAIWRFFGPFSDVELAIFEVGMGGTWDPTNAIPHSVCGVASIGLDHQAVLGSTLGEIAGNKFGIVSPGSTVVHTQFSDSDVLAVLRKTQAAVPSTWIEAPCFPHTCEKSSGEPHYRLHTPWGDAVLRLPGRRGAENTSIALKLFEALGHSPGASLAALSQVRWPGRMEKVKLQSVPFPVYLSGDHNPAGIQSLMELLRDYTWNHLYFVVGLGQDKDLGGILEPLTQVERSSLCLTQISYKSRTLADYGPWLSRSVISNASVWECFKKLVPSLKSGDMVVVTGSLYLVGEVRKRMDFQETERN